MRGIKDNMAHNGVKVYLDRYFPHVGGFGPFYAAYTKYIQGGNTHLVKELALHYGVSRQTIYKWIRREDEEPTDLP